MCRLSKFNLVLFYKYSQISDDFLCGDEFPSPRRTTLHSDVIFTVRREDTNNDSNNNNARNQYFD